MYLIYTFCLLNGCKHGDSLTPVSERKPQLAWKCDDDDKDDYDDYEDHDDRDDKEDFSQVRSASALMIMMMIYYCHEGGDDDDQSNKGAKRIFHSTGRGKPTSGM